MSVPRPPIVSPYSRTVTLDGITVRVEIFRRRDSDQWSLIVIHDAGTATIWETPFETEIEALAAFQVSVQEEGMVQFLDDGGGQTIH